MIYTDRFASPLGFIRIGCTQDALIGLWFDGQKYTKSTMPEGMVGDARQPAIVHAREWLDGYFSGKRPSVTDICVAPRGTPFRQSIWKLLLDIPYGETVTYGMLAAEAARHMGKVSMSAQAVGGAVGHNPISIVIPCHRVVGADGSLTGYAGGIERKEWLLKHEGFSF